MFQIPGDATQVVTTVEKLKFFKVVFARSIRLQRRVNSQESVQSTAAGPLWADHQNRRKSMTSFLIRPNIQQTTIVARILCIKII